MPATPDNHRPETILAFDFGLSRIGVAVGQQITGSAGPVGAIGNGADGPDWRRIDELVAEWRPARLVVGLPLHSDGSPSAIQAPVKAFVGALARYRLPVETVDERYSSLEARHELVEGRRSGRTRRLRRETVDAVAAVLIAERWLDRPRGPAPRKGEESPPD